MDDLPKLFEAQTKSEAIKFYREADKHNEVVNEAYRQYNKAAMVVARLYEENGYEIPHKGMDEYKPWVAAVAAKKKFFVEWQKEAHRHGAMFVPLMDFDSTNTNVDQKEPW